MATRRSLLATASLGAGLCALGNGRRLLAANGPPPLQLRKALKYSMIQAGESVGEKLALAKEAGFEGVEFDNTPLSNDQIEAILQAKEQTGLEVPGLVCGAVGRKLGSFDPAEREEGVKQFGQALNQARELGGTTVLAYPGRVDPKHPYEKVYETLQVSIRELIPVAESSGTKIACENVWNNIFLSPIEVRDFLDGFGSAHVGWYFDIGNVVRYGWPEQWIRVLGSRIFKLDIKDFDLQRMMNEGARKGFVELGEGSVDWPEVMKALTEIAYAGEWASAEVRGGDLERLKTISSQMDTIFGG